MKHRLMSLAALVLAMLMLAAAASAETISLSGTVTARETWEVYAPIGGSVEEVCARVGQHRVLCGEERRSGEAGSAAL